MSLDFAHGAIQWLAADAATTTYTVSGLSFQPKAIRFYWVGLQNAADAVSEAVNQRRGVGFASSTSSRRCVGSFAQDTAGTSNCGTVARNDAIAVTTDGAGATDGLLDITTFASDGFTLTVDDATPANITVFWEAWGGADVTNVTIGDIAEPASTGDVDYSATGFVSGNTDAVVMLAGVQSTAAVNTAAAGDSGMCVGFATGSGAQNIVLIGNSDDASTAMDTDGYARGDECLGMIVVAGGTAVDARAALTQFGTDNFRLNWAARAVTSRRSIYMAVKGGQWRAGDYTIAGNTGSATATVSGLPFAPKGISLIGRMATESASNSAETNDRMGFGSGSSTSSRRSMGVLDENATASSACEINTTIQYDQVLCFPSTAGALQSAYDINAMNSDGFQIIVDTAGGVASEWQGYLAFGDLPPGNGGASVPPSAQPLQQITRFARWFQPDELPAGGAPTIALDAGDWWPLGAVIVAAAALSTCNHHNDEVPTPPVSVVVDDDPGWQSPVVLVQKPAVTVWSAQDELPVATVFDEDGWSLPRVAQAPWVVLFNDSEILVPSVVPSIVEDWPEWKPPPSAQTIARIEWVTGDEIEQTPESPAAGGQQYATATQSIKFIRWYQEDSLGAVTAPLPVEDDLGPRFTPLADGILSAVWATDEDITPEPSFDDYWITPFSIDSQLDLRVWAENDDIAATAATAVPLDDEWSRFAPAVGGIKSVIWATDEGSATVAALPIDSDEWQPFAPAVGGIKSVIWATDEGSATVAALPIDSDEWQPFAPAVGGIKSVIWATDEGSATVAALPIDSDEWQPFAPAVGGIKSVIWATDEGSATVAALPIDSDEWQPFAPAVGGIKSVIWATDEGSATAAPGSIGFDEAYWLKPFSIQPPHDSRLWAETDDRLPVASPAIPADDDWIQFAPRLGDISGIVWASEEAGVTPQAGALPFDESHWLKPFSITVSRDLRLWQGTDEIEQAATPLPFDESYWLKPFSITPLHNLRLWQGTDEVEQAASIQFDESYWIQPFSIASLHDLRLWQATDEIEQAVTPLPFDESYWIRPFSITPPPDLRLWATTDEQVQPAVPNEEYWHPLYSIAVPPIDHVERHQDDWEVPPAPLFTDVEFWPWFQLRTAVVPAIAPLFQADDEQGDFVAPPEPPAPSPAPGVDLLDPRYMGGRYPNVGFKPIKPPKSEKAKLEPPLPAQITNMPDAPILAPRRGPLMEIMESLGREPLLKAPSPSKQAAPVIAKPAPAPKPKPKPAPQPTVAPAPSESGEILDAVREMMNVRESALREELRQVQEQLANVQAELASKDDRAAQRKVAKNRRKSQQVAAELSLKLLDDDI